MNTVPTVSVVIPTFNRAPMVKRCVASVLASEGVDLECIVVDDHSPDDTGDVLREAFGADPRFRYHRNEKNLKHAASTNAGARLARGEFIFFLDDDNIIERDAVKALLGAVIANPSLGMVAPVSVNQLSDGSRKVWTLGSDFNRWTSQPKDFMPGCPETSIPESSTLLPTTYSPNAYMVRRRVFESVGGFSEEFELMFDESDFGWRLRENGWSCAICTLAKTTHFGYVEPGVSSRLRVLGIENPRRTWLFGRHRIWFAKRHFPLPCRLSVIFVFAPLSVLWYGVVALRNGRSDIALAYLCGTFRGVFSRKPSPPAPIVREPVAADKGHPLNRRILFLSSTRHRWFESQDAEEHVREAPYSINAIGYNLVKRGWSVAWAGWKSGHRLHDLARRIDAFEPNVVYTYGSTIALHPLFCRRFLCKHKDFKVVHGWDDHYGRIWGDLAGWPGRVFMDWMEKRIVRNSDAVVTLSYELQKIGRRWGVECHYIPNGADPIEGLEVADGPKLEGRFKIVYTGDKARWKRTEDICRAMKSVPKDVKLYLTGRTEDYLKPYASDNCIFLGWLSKPEQYAVMSQADAFVCTSDQDSPSSTP